MWSAYQSLKAYQRRPSADLEETDSIAAYCVDNAVLTFGIVIENALAETVEVGMGNNKRNEAKYTLAQLLDNNFKLPRPAPAKKTPKVQPAQDGFALLLALAGQPGSNVKRWEYVKPS